MYICLLLLDYFFCLQNLERDLWKKPVAPHFFVFCVQGAFFFAIFKTGLVQQF